MKADADLTVLARRLGILDEFTDMQGCVRHVTPETQRALIAANGLAAGSAAEVSESLSLLEAADREALLPGDVVIEQGESTRLPLRSSATWSVLDEADGKVLAEGRAEEEIILPALPPGVHRLSLDRRGASQDINLIVAPPRAPSVQDITGQSHTWGVVAAFYGLTGRQRKTLADYDDLAEFAQCLGRAGAAFLGINPVHALGTAATDVISPYSPTHRGFLNTDHIALNTDLRTEVPRDLLDYGAHRQVQRAALAQAFDVFRTRPTARETASFDAFCRNGGEHLENFARFEALSEIHGPDSRLWPVAPEAIQAAAPDRVIFHKWMQWLAETQLARAHRKARQSGMSLGLYLDLAVGARVGGAEGWGAQTATADGVTLGAPPDHLSPAGQNWNLAALSPRKLQASGYDAFRFVLRQNMRHCGLFRIDHALGLSRSFWIPEDGSPGGYIRQPFQSLMAIIAIEAHRAGTVVVGEDLGLVPAGFREEMASRGLYGYSVLQYEKDEDGNFLSPDALRPRSLACFGTHDTPTLAGFWQGRDIEWWEKLGWIETSQAARAIDRRSSEKRQLAGIAAPEALPQSASPGLRDAVHARLAASPAALVAVQLDDILAVSDAQNLPGTVDEHPNWRRIYPKTLQQIADSADLKKTADIMARAGRASKMRKDSS